MSILIKGMEMPKNCWECDFRTGLYCEALFHEPSINYYRGIKTRETFCPLVEVPTPHGRLIDADDTLKYFYGYEFAKEVIGSMPTIIEAEE